MSLDTGDPHSPYPKTGSSHILIGCAFPQVGGISVFIRRRQHQLIRQGHTVQLEPFAEFSFRQKLHCLRRLAGDRTIEVVELHAYYFLVMLALLARRRPCTVVFHVHYTHLLDDFDPLRRLVLQKFMDRTDRLICVNGSLVSDLRSRHYRLPADTVVEAPFLAPDPDEEAGIRQGYDPATLEFTDSHRPLIIANAAHLLFHNGVDLYGLDMCVTLVAGLKPDFPHVGLVFAIGQLRETERSYLDAVTVQIERLGLRSNIHLLLTGQEIWPLFKRADLMVRPAATDTYGISVAEALHFGCPAVASDVCERPQGTRLFASRNADAFLAAVRKELETGRHRPAAW